MARKDSSSRSRQICVGDILDDKFRVRSLLGRGGMGLVVAAEHLKLEEPVAIKILVSQTRIRAEDRARFAREGKAASKLRSEHVVRVHDVGELAGGVPYLVMELLDGKDLAAVVRDHGPLPPAHAVECLLEACEAVAEAHALGILHRDLKPSNLFLTRRAEGSAHIKLLDFGISKVNAPDDRLQLTKTREIIGSPRYMAPEVLRGDVAADVTAEVWSLGAVLYELLIGTAPMPDLETSQVAAIVQQDIPLRLRQVIARCLEPNPANRYATVAELAGALTHSVPGVERDFERRLERLMKVCRAASERLAQTDRSSQVPAMQKHTARRVVNSAVSGMNTEAVTLTADVIVTVSRRPKPTLHTWAIASAGALLAGLAVSYVLVQ